MTPRPPMHSRGWSSPLALVDAEAGARKTRFQTERSQGTPWKAVSRTWDSTSAVASPLPFNPFRDPVTPRAGMVVSPDSFPRSEIVVLDEEDAENYDAAFPPKVADDNRFGANVLVLTTDFGPAPIKGPPVPGDVRRALVACVS